jgi:hypothetical protein
MCASAHIILKPLIMLTSSTPGMVPRIASTGFGSLKGENSMESQFASQLLTNLILAACALAASLGLWAYSEVVRGSSIPHQAKGKHSLAQSK